MLSPVKGLHVCNNHSSFLLDSSLTQDHIVWDMSKRYSYRFHSISAKHIELFMANTLLIGEQWLLNVLTIS